MEHRAKCLLCGWGGGDEVSCFEFPAHFRCTSHRYFSNFAWPERQAEEIIRNFKLLNQQRFLYTRLEAPLPRNNLGVTLSLFYTEFIFNQTASTWKMELASNLSSRVEHNLSNFEARFVRLKSWNFPPGCFLAYLRYWWRNNQVRNSRTPLESIIILKSELEHFFRKFAYHTPHGGDKRHVNQVFGLEKLSEMERFNRSEKL